MQKNKYHFVGIKGVAMTALAVWAKEQGVKVSGSDTDAPYPTDTVLEERGIKLTIGFSPEHISQMTTDDIVIYTGAHGGRGNVEVKEAMRRGIRAWSHAQALGEFMSPKRQVAIAGCHGKTTTSAMLATIAMHASVDPSYVVGSGKIKGLGLPGHAGKGEWFIAEADEYVTDPQFDKTPRFLWMKPEILVVTNIDFDHPDVYASLQDVQEAYVHLVEKQSATSRTIVNADDVPSRVLDKKASTLVLYGEHSESNYVIKDIQSLYSGGMQWTVYDRVTETTSILTSPLSGNHIVYNATAAAVAAREMNISWDVIQQGLNMFGGVRRRFDILGTIQETVYIDDYAHHPTEIGATIAAARMQFPQKRIVAVFQPHTYSRTTALFQDFSDVLRLADVAIVTAVYGSAREQSQNISVRDMITTHPQGIFAETVSDVASILDANTEPGDVVLFMGAGDIYEWGRSIYQKKGKHHAT